MSRELQKLAKDLKPFMARWIEGGAGGSAGAAGGAPSPHELEGIHHTGNLNFNTINEVNIGTPADNDLLAWDSASGKWLNQTAAEAGISAVGHTHAHGDLTSITSDQHHAQAHALSGGDHTGDLAYTQLDSLVDTSGGGSASLISGAQHAHTGADGSSQIDSANFTGTDWTDLTDAGETALHTHAAGGSTLGSLTDVTITSVTDNEVLAYDTTAVGWINQTAAEAGLSAAGHTHTHASITSVSSDQHHAQVHAIVGADHSASGLTVGYVIRASGATTFAWAQLLHTDLGTVTSDQHHAQAHTLSGGDHTGDLAYTQLDSLVDTTGGGSASLISGAQHVHTGADGSSQIAHSDLTGITSDVHHAQVHTLIGADHTATGLTVGYVIRATAATTFAWQQLAHTDLGSVSSDQHHAQSHTLSGGDHTGDLAYSQLDSLVDTTGGGSASLISGAQHVHTAADGSSKVTYTDLLSIPSTFPPASHDLDSHSDVVISGTPADNELLAWNTGTSRWINQTAAEAALATASHTHTHASITSVSSDQHHAQAHALSGGDHTGDLAYSQLDSLVDTTGGGSASLISGAQHVHTGADGSSAVSHSNLSSVTSDQHHAQAHALSGGDHTGDLAYSQLDAIVDTTGGGSASLISAAVHAHTGADGSSKIDSVNFTGTDWTDLTDTGLTTLHSHSSVGSHTLDDHSDVLISGTPADNEVLAYDSVSGDWINQTAAEAGLSASGHTHDHGTLTGLGDDDHSAVYPGYGQTETISGAWTYSNGLTLSNNKWIVGEKAVSGTVNLISVNTSDAVIVGATGVDTTIWGADVNLYGSEDLMNIGLTSGDANDKLISLIETMYPVGGNTRWMYAELFHTTTDGYFQVKWVDNTPQTVHIVRFGINGSTLWNFLDIEEISAPGTPASGFVRVYAKTDGDLYRKDDSGGEKKLGADLIEMRVFN